MQIGGNAMMPGDGGVGSGDGGDGTIDLGQPPPGGGGLGQEAEPSAPQTPDYPSVMLSGGPELGKIPDSGKSLFHHKVISRRVHTPTHGPHKGKKRHEVEMQLQKVKPMRGYKKAPSKSAKSDDQEAMEKLMGSE